MPAREGDMRELLDSFPYPRDVLTICSTLGRHGFSCYLVGGCVRDILRGKEMPGDFDFATDATPEETSFLFEHTIPTGIRFGTVTVMFGKTPFEVTTFRGDGVYHDGRRPEIVSFKKDIYEDLARRDFTLNALAYDPVEKRLVDEFGGVRDMAAGIIRTVGKAEDRLLEDGLRIMRAFRFMSFGKLDGALVDAIMKHRHILTKISKERIRVELVKIMSCDDPSPILRAMGEAGIFDIVYRPLSLIVRHRELREQVLGAVSHLRERDHALRFALLFACVGFHEILHEKTVLDFSRLPLDILKRELKSSALVCRELLRKETFSRKDIETISSLVRLLWVPYRFLSRDEPAPGQLRLAKVKYKNTMDQVISCVRAWELAAGNSGTQKALDALESRLDAVSIRGHELPIIDGNIIMEHLGISRSRKIGTYKERLYRFQVVNDITDRELLLEELRRMAGAE